MKRIYKFLFILIILIKSGTLCAQAPNWIWATSSAGNSEDIGYGIATDNFGNVYESGFFIGASITFGGITLFNSDSTLTTDDVFIVKHDSSGNVLWAKSAGGSYTERCYSVATDFSGNVYVAGYFESDSISFDGITLYNRNAIQFGSDIFLVKYNSNGVVLWAKSEGGNEGDIGLRALTDYEGNIYVIGYFASDTISIGSTVLLNQGYSDALILKYDSSGNFLWANSLGGDNRDDFFAGTTDPAGNIYVSGQFQSDSIIIGSTTLNNNDTTLFSHDVLLIKFDSSGNVRWAKSYGGKGDDVGFSIATDYSGEMCLTGYFASDSIVFDSITLVGNGDYDMFIAKIDSGGNVIWAKSAGGNNDDRGFSACTDNNNHVLVAGFFDSPTISYGTTTLTNAGIRNSFIVEYDSIGNIIWAKSIGGSNIETIYVITSDVIGEVYVTGFLSSSSVSFGTSILHSTGSSNAFIAKLGKGINTSIISLANDLETNIFPNPTRGKFVLQDLGFMEMKIRIYASTGECIYSSILNSSQTEIDLANLAKGIYYYELQNEADVRRSGKIIIE